METKSSFLPFCINLFLLYFVWYNFFFGDNNYCNNGNRRIRTEVPRMDLNGMITFSSKMELPSRIFPSKKMLEKSPRPPPVVSSPSVEEK